MSFSSMNFPVLETERLLLRGWSESDHDVLCDIWSSGDNARFIGGPMSRWDAWRHLAAIMGHWQMRGFGAFCIEEKSTGLGIGWVGPWRPYAWPENEILYSLIPDAHGRGYATEAAEASINFAYDTLNWHTAVSFIDPNNLASQSVASRLGAYHDGDTDLGGKYFVQVWRYPEPDKFRETFA